MLLSGLRSQEMIQQQGRPKVGTERQCWTVATDSPLGAGYSSSSCERTRLHRVPQTRQDPGGWSTVTPPCFSKNKH